MENRFDQGYLECYMIGFAGSFRGTAVAATGSGQPIRVMQLVKLSWRRRAATAIDAARSPRARARARARCRGLRVSLLPKFSDTTTAGNPGTTGCQCAIGENVTCAQRCNLEIEPSFSIAPLLVLALAQSLDILVLASVALGETRERHAGVDGINHARMTLSDLSSFVEEAS